MKASANDKLKGTFHEAKGKIKEVAGIIANQPDLEIAGITEKIAGKAQVKVGEIKKVLGK